MKIKKFCGLVLLMSSLMISACGPKPAPSSNPSSEPDQSQPSSQGGGGQSSQGGGEQSSQGGGEQSSQGGGGQSSGGGESSQGSEDSSSVSTDPAVTVTSFGLSKKTDKVYLTAVGTYANLTAAQLKFALALEHTGAAQGGGDGQTGYIVGGETFADADYNIVATPGNDNAFSIEYNLSDCANLAQGSYFVKLAVKGVDDIATPTAHDDVELNDGDYKYYFRSDITNRLTVHIEELPPLAFTSATIVTDDQGKIWAKIGGAVAAGLTQADFDAYDTFMQFQQVGGSWTKTRLNKADGGFKWEVKDGNAFIYADVSLFAAGNNYNTHLNVKYGSEANCRMENAIDQHYNVKNGDNWLDINVYCNPQASGSDQSEFWGNLGFKVKRGVDPDAPVVAPKVNFKTYTTDEVVYSNAAPTTAEDTGANPFKAVKIASNGDKFTLNYTAAAAEIGTKVTVRFLYTTKSGNAGKCGFWFNEHKSAAGDVKTTVKLNGDALDTPTNNDTLEDLGASAVSETAKDGSTALYMPVWYDAIEITLAAENAIEFSYTGKGYSYWICGAALAK